MTSNLQCLWSMDNWSKKASIRLGWFSDPIWRHQVYCSIRKDVLSRILCMSIQLREKLTMYLYLSCRITKNLAHRSPYQKKNRKILPQLYNISIGNLRKGVILYFVKKKIHFISVGKLQILRTKLIAHSGTPNCDEKGGRGVAAVWYPRGCLPFSWGPPSSHK